MIIVCEKCKASFLVPASLFTQGARAVRCARCNNTWVANPSGPKPAPPPPPPKPSPAVAVAPAEKLQPSLEPLPSIFAIPPVQEPQPEAKPRRNLVATLKGWAASLREVPWRKLGYRAACFLTGSIILVSLVFVFGHDPLVQRWPALEQHYIDLGLSSEPVVNETLVLDSIRSERRYMDGAMHLVVEGSIANRSSKTLVLPALQAEALGPNEQVIQRWRIEPPTATLKPGTDVSFFSAILSPEGTVNEVNLSFAEPPHDEP